MCYSAMIVSEWKKFRRFTNAKISLSDYTKLFVERVGDLRVRIPRATEAWFDDPQSEQERVIRSAIEQRRTNQAADWEQEMFAQAKRLADAKRKLAVKITKTATNDERIATKKIETLKGWIADLKRSEPKSSDARIYPDWYAPVVVMEAGERVVKPMRYHCLPAGKPAFYDEKYPGTFNARRDSLDGFWKGVFSVTHGVMLWDRFYENVGKDGKNVVLEFVPDDHEPMLVACLWSRWSAPGKPDLLSCAAITDEPPPEVAAAGHDRCIIPLRAEHVDAWLQPDPKDLAASYALLDDRVRPYYEHRLAA